MKVIARIGILGICASLLLGSVGCHLCCAPYDYCGPVWEGGQCSDLSRVRCGSVTAIGGCSTCGQHGAVAPDQAVPAQGAPTAAPAPAPTPAPAPAPAAKSVGPQVYRGLNSNVRQVQATQPVNQTNSQVVPATATQPVAPNRSLVVGRPASQKPVEAPTAVSVGNQNAGQLPKDAVIAVGPDGFQKVEVYDEKGQFLGYETIDATGKTVQALDLSKLPLPESK